MEHIMAADGTFLGLVYVTCACDGTTFDARTVPAHRNFHTVHAWSALHCASGTYIRGASREDVVDALHHIDQGATGFPPPRPGPRAGGPGNEGKDAMTATSTTAPAWYVMIDRARHADLAVRYPTRAAATAALSHSAFIDALCEEDCVDAWVSGARPGAYRLVPERDDAGGCRECGQHATEPHALTCPLAGTLEPHGLPTVTIRPDAPGAAIQEPSTMRLTEAVLTLGEVAPVDAVSIRPLRVLVDGLPGGARRVIVGYCSPRDGVAAMSRRVPVLPLVREHNGQLVPHVYEAPSPDTLAAVLAGEGLAVRGEVREAGGVMLTRTERLTA